MAYVRSVSPGSVTVLMKRNFPVTINIMNIIRIVHSPIAAFICFELESTFQASFRWVSLLGPCCFFLIETNPLFRQILWITLDLKAAEEPSNDHIAD